MKKYSAALDICKAHASLTAIGLRFGLELLLRLARKVFEQPDEYDNLFKGNRKSP